jgi:holo-[acyl-carrier protein] synthase
MRRDHPSGAGIAYPGSGYVEQVPADQASVSVRVGIDLVAVDAVAQSLDSSLRDRYLARVFTDAEVGDCTTAAGDVDAARLAGRFAAKEAALKALRAGDTAVPWREVEVARAPDGDPSLVLHGVAAELAASAGLHHFAVSLTHEQAYASAVVVATP